MRNRPLAGLALVLALSAVAVWLLFFRRPDGPRLDLDPYRALGSVAAGEAQALSGGRGDLVLVTPDQSDGADPVLAAQVAAFRQALDRGGKARIAAVEEVKIDGFTAMQTGGALPPERYLALRRKHAAAAVLVLFFAFPPLSAAELDGLGKEGPRVLVVSAALPGYEQFLARRAMDVAIVPRPAEAASPAAPDTKGTPDPVRAVFDREYVILRANAEP